MTQAQKTKTGFSLFPGKRLGKYRLVKHLGEGGSCEVWKARDWVEGIWVALKIPLAGMDGRRDNQTLLKEIRMVTQLRHRHIMPVKNADIIEDHVVLATPLSVGTLDDKSRPMSPKKIISIMTHVLDGLAYAHRHRLVHCDVTPGNIFLFPDGRAALGDFGISMRLQGKPVTIDDFGTPGYVAPEQAYGKPTYQSDCFAAALVLYEYLTGVLPRWPFRWPPKGAPRLKKKMNLKFFRFMQKALSIDPAKRFDNAGEMHDALIDALPKAMQEQLSISINNHKRLNWKKMRRLAFVQKYKRVFGQFFNCTDCGNPIAEVMGICPWCGSDKNRYDSRSAYDYICTRCHKGIAPEWHYCPWCYGGGFESPHEKRSAGLRYHRKCKHCGKPLMHFMKYCPWCRRKVNRPWQVRPFPEVCGTCGWSVDTDFWIHCPWCEQQLI